MNDIKRTALQMSLTQVRFMLNSEKERLHYSYDELRELENKILEIMFNQSIIESSIQVLEEVKELKEKEHEENESISIFMNDIE